MSFLKPRKTDGVLFNLVDVRLRALERLAFVGQVGGAIEVGHLAAGGVDAEVAVVARAAVQVQAEVEALARCHGFRDLHDPGRNFRIGDRVFGNPAPGLGVVVAVQVEAPGFLVQAEAELEAVIEKCSLLFSPG